MVGVRDGGGDRIVARIGRHGGPAVVLHADGQAGGNRGDGDRAGRAVVNLVQIGNIDGGGGLVDRDRHVDFHEFIVGCIDRREDHLEILGETGIGSRGRSFKRKSPGHTRRSAGQRGRAQRFPIGNGGGGRRRRNGGSRFGNRGGCRHRTERKLPNLDPPETNIRNLQIHLFHPEDRAGEIELFRRASRACRIQAIPPQDDSARRVFENQVEGSNTVSRSVDAVGQDKTLQIIRLIQCQDDDPSAGVGSKSARAVAVQVESVHDLTHRPDSPVQRDGGGGGDFGGTGDQVFGKRSDGEVVDSTDKMIADGTEGGVFHPQPNRPAACSHVVERSAYKRLRPRPGARSHFRASYPIITNVHHA